MTEDEAYREFRRLRWPDTNGEPVCPKCGSLKAYEITTRRKFRCAGCAADFSVTSGTMFAYRKMTYSQCMVALDAVKRGSTPTQIMREVKCDYRTAHQFFHKARVDIIGVGITPI